MITATGNTTEDLNLLPVDTNGEIRVGVSTAARDLRVYGNILPVNEIIFQSGAAAKITLGDTVLEQSKLSTTQGNLTLDAANSVEVASGTDLDVNGDFNVDGSTTLNGTTVDGTLTVNGAAQIDHININGNVISSTGNQSGVNGDINIVPNGNRDVYIGDAGTNELIVTGDIRAFDTSDRTLKENITPIPNALDKILSLSGNTFTWIEEAKRGGEHDIGVIAQEVEALGLPNLTTTRSDGTKAVMYKKLIPVLIEAIKELKSEIEELKK